VKLGNLYRYSIIPDQLNPVSVDEAQTYMDKLNVKRERDGKGRFV
ncbi:unnamed protein product, partial [marine sediment metagenome]